MTYDRSAIMNAAWAYARAEIAASRINLSGRSRRFIFKHALRRAWAEARMARAAALQTPRVAAVNARIFALEGQNRWTQADYRLRDQLTNELQAAVHAA